MKIGFVYLGPLKYRGRLFKQIQTLQQAGFDCMLVHGRTEPVEPDYSQYSFPVLPIRVIQERAKLLTLASQLNFDRKASRLLEQSEVDTVVCVGLTSALAGALAKKRNPRLRFIFDSNELELESYSSRIKQIVWGRIQNHILAYPDVVMHAEQHRLDYFHQTYKTQAHPFLLENLPFFRETNSQKDKTEVVRCVYVGGFMPQRHCAEMLQAFADSSLPVGWTFDMVGFYASRSYEDTIQQLLMGMDLERIRILPPVAHNEMYQLLTDYDIGLAFYENTDLNNYYCAPNKVYDYLQMGMPVITNDYPGLIDIVASNRAGVCLPEVTPQGIQTAIKTIEAEGLSHNISREVRQRYSWENQVERYLQLFA
ncbi:MAG: glycosyltransferase [Candidatus Delongbacteria bacterium]|nr:glycosyltransferase [Candidatus Delongbacteria bacterium]